MRLFVLWFVAVAALAALGAACERTAPGDRGAAAPAAKVPPASPEQAAETAAQRPANGQASERRGDRHARAAARRSPAVKRISGTVSRADARVIAIRPAGAPPLSLRVEPGTTITVDGRPARLDAVREGAEVRASYRSGGGRPTAIAIEAHTPPVLAPAERHEAEPSGANWGTSPEPPPVGGG